MTFPNGEVYNLQDGGPRKALEEHCSSSHLKDTDEKDVSTNFRMLVCGGDGSVGWALSVMDIMNIPIGKSYIKYFGKSCSII